MGFWDGLTDAFDQFTGHAGAQAAREASRQMVDAYNQGLGVQKDIYGKSMESLKPYTAAGETGLQGQLAGLADPSRYYGYQFQEFNPTAFNPEADTAYQFRLQQGLGAATNSQAARGLQNSGGAMKELANYATGLASQASDADLDRQFQRWQANQAGGMGMAQARASGLSGLANMGYGATTQGNQLGQNYGNQYMQGMQGIGEARAAGTLGAQNALQGGFQNFMDLGKGLVKGGLAYGTGGLSGLAGLA
jgi:hypothetical protein